MASKRDYYTVLGVEQNADLSDIKRAYRRLAMDHHPDRNPGDQAAEERFKELAEAYQVLSDPEKRSLYDRYGHEGPRQAGFQGFGGVEDILRHFADFFGGGFGGAGGGVERGRDLQAEATITLIEAARGCVKELELDRLVHCTACRGSGARAGSSPSVCGTCGGRGQVAHNQGIFMIATTCPTCRGSGRTVREKCGDCRGSGLERKRETVSVTVPAGIDDGQTLRVPGKGQASQGGQPGHLYLTFKVEEDPRFERHGDDLITEVRIGYAQATLGSQIRVPTLDGEEELEIAPGTQPGTMHVLRGRGMPNVHGRGIGDLGVRVNVAVPRKLSSEQRSLIEELQRFEEVEEESPPPPTEEHDTGFFFKRRKKKR